MQKGLIGVEKLELWETNKITITVLAIVIAALSLFSISFETLALSQILKNGSQGAEVREVQKYLYELKYLSVKPTGTYGDKTAAAVKAFQQKNGLWADGRVGNGTYNLLKKAYNAKNPTIAKAVSSSAKAEKKEAQSTTNTTADSSTSIMKSGTKGTAVLELQKKLKQLNYLAATPNGVFGNATTAAVKAFQKSHGLTADGRVGSATLESINQAIENDESKAVSDAVGDLKLNMQGDRVREVQTHLKELKYLAVEPTGYYGKMTELAVKEFQSDFKLTVDGRVGETTYQAIREALNNKSSATIVGEDPKEPVEKTSQETLTHVLQLGVQSEEVLRIQEILTKLEYYTEEATGIYDEEVAAAVRAFQDDNALKTTGKVDAETYEILNKALDERQKVKNVLQHKMKIYATPWALVHKEWERLQVATVIDVKTEKSFKVQRFGGYYHSDVEPCTAEDTRIMLEIFGGKWSWNRRAIIVELNGKYIAASMNGMPHMKYTVRDNNFNGHFCIHFLGSRVHRTRRLDAAHQKMVQAALHGGSEQAEIEGEEDD